MNTENHDVEEYEFWLFTALAPLPDLKDVAPLMSKIAPCVKLKTQGLLTGIPEGVVKAELGDEDGGAEIDVCWEIQFDETRQAFKRDQQALKALNGYPTMLRFLIDEDYALEPAFAMMHALLTLSPGLLVIPDEEGQITLPRQDALAFLEEEIKENREFLDE